MNAHSKGAPMASDTIRLICPNLRCKAILSVPAKARGRDVHCKHCGKRIKIPGGNSSNHDEGKTSSEGQDVKQPAG